MDNREEKNGAFNATGGEKGQNNAVENNKKSVERSNLIAGLVLIFLGICGLLHRYIPRIEWQTLWPILLIVLGIFLIIPIKNKRS